jgi:hypothetical protein
MSTSNHSQPALSLPRELSAGIAIALVIGLSGCVGAEPTTAEPPAESPVASTSVPSVAPEAVSILPECDAAFTSVGFAVIRSENLEWTDVVSGSESDPGLSLLDSRLEPALGNNARTSCSFTLPAAERGMSLYVILMSESDSTATATANFFESNGYTVSSPATGGGTIFSLVVEGDYPFTEARLIRDDLLVSSFDSLGTAAIDYVTDASAQIALLSTP